MYSRFFPKPALAYTLVCALAGALISDTIYAYPLFGPRLSSQLGYTKLEANVVAAAGNVGLFLSEPLLGALTDQYGPRYSALSGALLLFCSFAGLAALYVGQLFTTSFVMAVSLLLLLGIGTAAVQEAAFTSVARNFPPSVRGTMLGLLYMFFSLSGLFYSGISARWFASSQSEDRTYDFLRVLALITGFGTLAATTGLKWHSWAADEDVDVTKATGTA
ncbi:major facilitator superfamily domain-containing protein [Thamnocephalis sphaerospora]|uniref:Major facilitator superfamily domain-containing protein n=1 Tax=Thamnocephalis sphaerospora TaxID=78915 RepID=A0A4P9XJ53_9FUNG|nr:major facilitator superfamily domain-containing protein [Thamnocephalis sphaerospora]|eukprot:RKP05767.1 major facilitator superfamily domain-containing protein [Thamnocephalis sphaerospora]